MSENEIEEEEENQECEGHEFPWYANPARSTESKILVATLLSLGIIIFAFAIYPMLLPAPVTSPISPLSPLSPSQLIPSLPDFDIEQFKPTHLDSYFHILFGTTAATTVYKSENENRTFVELGITKTEYYLYQRNYKVVPSDGMTFASLAQARQYNGQ